MLGVYIYDNEAVNMSFASRLFLDCFSRALRSKWRHLTTLPSVKSLIANSPKLNHKLLTTDEIVVRENRLDKATRTFSCVKYVLFLLSPSQPTFTYEHSEMFTKD